MRRKLIAKDYKEELADIAEKKGFKQDAENLLLSMVYKIEDSYSNFQIVKREVPDEDAFIETIVQNVQKDCQELIIAEPRSEEAAELKKNKCTIMTESDVRTKLKRVISYPNEKTLLYGISKVALPPIMDNASMEENAILTTINIGKCIANSEVVRDFNGWSWYVLKDEIESTECNIVYTFLLFLLGYEFLENISIEKIKNFVSEEFYEELRKVSIQFYLSYDKTENEEILQKLSNDRTKLEKMKNQSAYLLELTEMKKNRLSAIGQIDEVIANPELLREQYLNYNSKKPNEEKIFSISHYEDMLEEKRQDLLNEIKEFNKMQNPNEYIKEKERLQYEIKVYEGKTDISKLQKEFLKHFEMIIDNTTDKKKILDLVFETRYLNLLPNCKMNLNDIEEKLIAKAIKYKVIAPVSNNNLLDYRILKGIFNSQIINMQNLYIKLSSNESNIKVEIYDGDMVENTYEVSLPEGSTVEIKKSKKMKVFTK